MLSIPKVCSHMARRHAAILKVVFLSQGQDQVWQSTPFLFLKYRPSYSFEFFLILKVWRPYATLFLYWLFCLQYILYIHTIIHSKHSLRPISISSVQWAKPPWDAEPRFDSGLPYSKPAHYHLSYAAPMKSYVAPSEPRSTLNELRCTPWDTLHPEWATLHPIMSYAASQRATLHPSELRCTILSYAASSELRCTLLSYAAS